jgi:hypothetical protein
LNSEHNGRTGGGGGSKWVIIVNEGQRQGKDELVMNVTVEQGAGSEWALSVTKCSVRK